MTYREKLKQDHPDYVGEKCGEGGCVGCPSYYGYEPETGKCPAGHDCWQCWDREISEVRQDED